MTSPSVRLTMWALMRDISMDGHAAEHCISPQTRIVSPLADAVDHDSTDPHHHWVDVPTPRSVQLWKYLSMGWLALLPMP